MNSDDTISRLKRAADEPTLGGMVRRARSLAVRLDEENRESLLHMIGDSCATYVARPDDEDEELHRRRLGEKIFAFAHLLDARTWLPVE
jgi:hypothetical protein